MKCLVYVFENTVNILFSMYKLTVFSQKRFLCLPLPQFLSMEVARQISKATNNFSLD